VEHEEQCMPVTETCTANANVSERDVEELVHKQSEVPKSDRDRTYCGCSSSTNRRPGVATKQGLKLVLANASPLFRHFGC